MAQTIRLSQMPPHQRQWPLTSFSRALAGVTAFYRVVDHSACVAFPQVVADKLLNVEEGFEVTAKRTMESRRSVEPRTIALRDIDLCRRTAWGACCGADATPERRPKWMDIGRVLSDT